MWFFYKMKNALKSETARGHFRNCDPLFLFFIAFFILTKPRYLSISDLEKWPEIKKFFETRVFRINIDINADQDLSSSLRLSTFLIKSLATVAA
jgi:hypothetical protein